MSNQRVVVLTDEEREGGLRILKKRLASGICAANVGERMDAALPDWLTSLVEKLDAAGYALENADVGPFDGMDLVRWAESYGHPEWWCTKAQELNAKCERLEGRLEHPEGITDEQVEQSARALWAQKRGTSSRPFDWDNSRRWWEEDARIVLEAAFCAPNERAET